MKRTILAAALLAGTALGGVGTALAGQAPSGTAKFTGVDGCEALARTALGFHASEAVPAATAPRITSRLVNMGNPPGDLPRKYNAKFRAVYWRIAIRPYFL